MLDLLLTTQSDSRRARVIIISDDKKKAQQLLSTSTQPSCSHNELFNLCCYSVCLTYKAQDRQTGAKQDSPPFSGFSEKFRDFFQLEVLEATSQKKLRNMTLDTALFLEAAASTLLIGNN